MLTNFILIVCLLATLGVFAIWIIRIYNQLVVSCNEYKNAFANIEVELTRRHDLVPNLVGVASRYLTHEQDTLTTVISARNHAENGLKQAAQNIGSGDFMNMLTQAEGALTGALSRLMAVVEAYPDLKADASMRQLSESLTETENKVALARQLFNQQVTHYNTLREVFPNNFISHFFDFKTVDTLPIESEAKRAAPLVQF